MNWTVVNVSGNTVSITDTPIPLTWEPGQRQLVPVAYVTASAQLSQAVANQQLCIPQYGAFAPLPRWAPLTYVVAGSLGAAGLQPGTVQQSGASAPLTLGPFRQGVVLANVTALSAGGSASLGFEAWDGTTYYPAETVIADITGTGPWQVAWAPGAPAGRFVWTVSGSLSWTLCYHVMP